MQAKYESEEKLLCETPSFEQFGAKKVDVVVSINKGDYTITKSYFTFYLNTKGENSIAYGPGLLNTNCAGEETCFII